MAAGTAAAAAPRRKPTEAEFARALVFEIRWLILGAQEYKRARTLRTLFQDACVVHARNLLEFTAPSKMKSCWHVSEDWIRGTKPPRDADWTVWHEFVHAKVLHLGPRRLQEEHKWPLPETDDRLLELSAWLLNRIVAAVPPPHPTSYAAIARTIANDGSCHLGTTERHSATTLDRLLRWDRTPEEWKNHLDHG